MITTPMTWPRAALLALALVLGACGSKIGDSCSSSTDCSQNGDRLCDSASPGGYCTIEGCNFNSCPSEAECVRFFPGAESGHPCSAPTDCNADEVCTLGGTCAPRASEVRFCMAKCGSVGDCRTGYECRDVDRMKAHGGQPVPDPNAATSTPPTQGFCAAARLCAIDSDCDFGDKCTGNFPNSRCTPQ